MNGRTQKVFVGILLLITAAALIFYGMGYGASVFGMPIYKLLIGVMLVAWMFSKIFFGNSLRERLKIFYPLAFLFMVLETEISHWAGLPDENIVNNGIVFLSAFLATIAINCIVPKKNRKNHLFGFRKNDRLYNGFESVDSNRLSSNTVFIDAAQIKKSYVKNTLGETNIYYQNTDNLTYEDEFILDISNCMGETDIHVPADWVVTSKMRNSMGEVEVRKNNGNGARLTVTGNNTMGETNIVSP